MAGPTPQVVIDPNAYSHSLKDTILKSIYDKCNEENGHIIWTKCKNSSGYPSKKIKLPNAEDGSTLALVHRVAFAFMNNMLIGNDSDDISHLCSIKTCLYIQHLSKEPHFVNQARTSCKLQKRCIGHIHAGHQYPPCILV